MCVCASVRPVADLRRRVDVGDVAGACRDGTVRRDGDVVVVVVGRQVRSVSSRAGRRFAQRDVAFEVGATADAAFGRRTVPPGVVVVVVVDGGGVPGEPARRCRRPGGRADGQRGLAAGRRRPEIRRRRREGRRRDRPGRCDGRRRARLREAARLRRPACGRNQRSARARASNDHRPRGAYWSASATLAARPRPGRAPGNDPRTRTRARRRRR